MKAAPPFAQRFPRRGAHHLGMSDSREEREATSFDDLLGGEETSEYSPGSAPGDPNFTSLDSAGTATNLNEDPDVGALNDPSGADFREGDVGDLKYPRVGGAGAYPDEGRTVSGDALVETDLRGRKKPDELGRLDPAFDPMSEDNR